MTTDINVCTLQTKPCTPGDVYFYLPNRRLLYYSLDSSKLIPNDGTLLLLDPFSLVILPVLILEISSRTIFRDAW